MSLAISALVGLLKILYLEALLTAAADLTLQNIEAPARWRLARKITKQTSIGPMEEAQVWKEIELDGGRTAQIKDGTVAEHNRALRAARNYGGSGVSQEMYLMTLFSELVEIDGETYSIDEIEDMPLRVYFPIQQALDEMVEGPTSAGEDS